MRAKERKILVVDDSESIRKMVKFCLAKKGYQVSSAKDGRDGLEKLIRNDYQLVLLDINMPQMDGFSFLRLINRDTELAKIPVIVFSTESQPQDKQKAFQLGAKKYLVKPFQPSQLIDLVKEEIG